MVAAKQNQKSKYTGEERILILPNKNHIVNLKNSKSHVFELIIVQPLKVSSQSTERNIDKKISSKLETKTSEINFLFWH